MSPTSTRPVTAQASAAKTRRMRAGDPAAGRLLLAAGSQVAAAWASPSASTAAMTGSSLYTLRNGASGPSSR